MTRRMVLRNVWIMFFAMVLIAALPFHAQSKTSYPEKPVQVLVGYGPGGGTDQVARAYCELMSKELGKKFLVINLPGAASANSINGLIRMDIRCCVFLQQSLCCQQWAMLSIHMLICSLLVPLIWVCPS